MHVYVYTYVHVCICSNLQIHTYTHTHFQVKDLKQYYQLYFPHGRYPTEVSDTAARLFDAVIKLGHELLTWIDEVRVYI